MRRRSTWIGFFSSCGLCVYARLWPRAGRAMTGKLPGTRRPPSSLFFAGPKAMRKVEKRDGTVIVATQSRFHRDMLDGEHIALKPLKRPLVPNFQVMALALSIRKNGSLNSRTILSQSVAFKRVCEQRFPRLFTVNYPLWMQLEFFSHDSGRIWFASYRLCGLYLRFLLGKIVIRFTATEMNAEF